VFPNPNAPTGIVLPLNDILSLAEYLEKHKKVLILDEAYIAFGAVGGTVGGTAGGTANNSAVPHINEHKNMLIVHTLSKSASLAGLRVGFAIGNEELIEGLCRIRDSFNSYTLDRLALAGASAAVADVEYYDEKNHLVIKTRERTAQSLRTLGFHVLPSSANFLFIKPPAGNGKYFFNALRERGILVRHFNKERIADYLRVSIGTDKDMETFLDTCQKIINTKMSERKE
jgi:histidinol-phosphate aminotransferase